MYSNKKKREKEGRAIFVLGMNEGDPKIKKKAPRKRDHGWQKRKHSKNQSQPFGSPTNKIVNKTHYFLLPIPLTPFPCF